MLPLKELEITPFFRETDRRIAENLSAMRLERFPTDRLIGIRIDYKGDFLPDFEVFDTEEQARAWANTNRICRKFRQNELVGVVMEGGSVYREGTHTPFPLSRYNFWEWDVVVFTVRQNWDKKRTRSLSIYIPHQRRANVKYSNSSPDSSGKKRRRAGGHGWHKGDGFKEI